MVRVLTITSDEKRTVRIDSEYQADGELSIVIREGSVSEAFRLFDDDILVDMQMLVAAMPIWKAFAAELGEEGARAKVRYNLELACEALRLPEQPLVEGQSLRARDPAGTILYMSIGCSVLAGVDEYPVGTRQQSRRAAAAKSRRAQAGGSEGPLTSR